MPIYEVRVTPAVARQRSGDAGTRNVAVVHTFSRHPTYYVGEVPPEIAGDGGLEVRELGAPEAAQALRGGVLVSAHQCMSDRLVRSLAGGATPPPAAEAPADLAARVEALEHALEELRAADPVEDLHAILERLDDLSHDELVALHEEVLGKKPHGNARDETIRDAIREVLEPNKE